LDYHVFIDQKGIKVERLCLTSKQGRMITAILFLISLLLMGLGLASAIEFESN
jgi:hypothetical protein